MGKRLYVGNLNFDTSEADLIAAFEQDGSRVANASIITDRDTGRPRGFAFVEMETDEAAKSAVQNMDGQELNGRELRVNEARERAPRSGGGGGGGGGRSHGGDRW